MKECSFECLSKDRIKDCTGDLFIHQDTDKMYLYLSDHWHYIGTFEEYLDGKINYPVKKDNHK